MGKEVKAKLESVKKTLEEIEIAAVSDVVGAIKAVDELIQIADEIEEASARALLVSRIFAVSHYTRSMAARVLKVSPSSIHERVKRGTLRSEVRDGEVLIPAWAIVQALEKKEKR